ncbi:amidohydrolase family protein [Brucepastera parasyntrophica]|uniref:amidohydrolase family protein n=1 Tax=Brucepastera parasyntrophica TaxID=2880008 RepID=UPI00210A4CA7|nr:amidohydrolase family protein [Brucepastera parasyntrophica]ULQ58684.1 amidohydrolase family protein [Brucepastera parasyntrophica]
MDYPIFDLHGHSGKWQQHIIDKNMLCSLAQKENIRKVLISSLSGMETPGHIPGGIPFSGQTQAALETLEECRDTSCLIPALVCQPGHAKADELVPLLENNTFAALKFHPYMLDVDADNELYDPFMELAEQYGLPAVFHSAPGTSDPAKIYRLARRHPKVKTVLYHINLTGDIDYGIEIIKTAMDRHDAELYGEVSWVPAEYVLKAIETCGFDRILFGTDLPLDGETHYSFYYPVIRAVESRYGEKATARFLYDNNLAFIGEKT